MADSRLLAKLFPVANRLPTFAQFHPAVTNFECENGELLVSGDSALPLIRYALGDRGGVATYDEVMAAAAEFPEAKRAALLAGRGLPPLPFVHVYERSDFSVKFRGAIIYAEFIRAALQLPTFSAEVTAKFAMAVTQDERHDERLEINVELRAGRKATDSLAAALRDAMGAVLREKSAEYRDQAASNPRERILPIIKLWPYGHSDYFGPGGKQRWVAKK